jgi:hypothetical protein
VRVPAHELGGDCFDHVGKIERALLLCHPGVENDLQQEVAELILQPDEIITDDRVRDFVGFLDCVRSDGAKTLLQVPRAAAAWRPQRRHDLNQAGDVAGGLHGAADRREGFGAGRTEAIKPCLTRIILDGRFA